MTPQVSVQQHAVHEQSCRPRTLFQIADMARRDLYAAPRRQRFIFIHGQSLLAAAAETCASFNLFEHSSQQTSTVLPPILTLIGSASNWQSQAAQVLSPMTFLQYPRLIRVGSVGHAAREA